MFLIFRDALLTVAENIISTLNYSETAPDAIKHSQWISYYLCQLKPMRSDSSFDSKQHHSLHHSRHTKHNHSLIRWNQIVSSTVSEYES